MASKIKGAVTVNKMKLRLDFDAFCAMEEETGKDLVELVGDIGAQAQKNGGLPSVRLLRDWIRWAMLSEEPETTKQTAQTFCNEIGLEAANKAVADLLVVSKLVADPDDVPVKAAAPDDTPNADDVGNGAEPEESQVST